MEFEIIDSGSWMNVEMKKEFDQLSVEEHSLLVREEKCGHSLRKVSSSAVNSLKNRYNLYRPLDETRVVLEHIAGVEGSDYISASYISGETPHSYKEFIACQAPLDSTVNDFWRMLWEQRCSVVVMLTALEGNKTSQYWPEQQGQVRRYGDLLVCNKKCFALGDVIVRSILVRNAASSATREIVHLQYIKWPDFGIPTSTKPVRDLLILTSKFQERGRTLYDLTGPIVTHCSAGVGRTGVFIACHITLERMRCGLEVDVKGTVTRLRNQRVGMVRTTEQYIFIYAVVLDAYLAQESNNNKKKIHLKRSPSGHKLVEERVHQQMLTTDSSEEIMQVGSSRVDLQACKLEYSIVSPK